MEGPGCPEGAVMGRVREPDPERGPPGPSTAGEKPQGQGGGFIHPVCDTDRETGTPLSGLIRESGGEMLEGRESPGRREALKEGSGTEGQRREGDRRTSTDSGLGFHQDTERGEDAESGGEMLEGSEIPGRREALKEGPGTEGHRVERRDSWGLHQDSERGEDAESGGEMLEGRESPGRREALKEGSGTEGQRGEGDSGERRDSGLGFHQDTDRGEDAESGGEMLEGRGSPGRREALKEGSGTEGQRGEGDSGERRDSGLGFHQDTDRGEDAESGGEVLEGRGSPGRREALKEGSGTEGQRGERDRVERRDSGGLHQDTERGEDAESGGEMLEGRESPGRREALKEGSGTEGHRGERDRGESTDSGGLHPDPERGEDAESGGEMLEGRESPGRREALKEGSGTEGQWWEGDRGESRDSVGLHQDTERGEDAESGGEMLEGRESPGRREALKEGSGTEGRRRERDRVERRDPGGLHRDIERGGEDAESGGEMLEGRESPGRREALKEGSGTEGRRRERDRGERRDPGGLHQDTERGEDAESGREMLEGRESPGRREAMKEGPGTEQQSLIQSAGPEGSTQTSPGEKSRRRKRLPPTGKKEE
ncbi:hypothetical protein NDU88_005001 [Pleurodeles waltl]|uniref:Uncharacterized protein n=1 Tax=Pleurodeles waltl TaxID=8319 RepID=A0AAV7V3C4_PLEWA|nr:hypothetical protein NDU88_005001 [Pleurodeles waltl]